LFTHCSTNPQHLDICLDLDPETLSKSVIRNSESVLKFLDILQTDADTQRDAETQIAVSAIA